MKEFCSKCFKEVEVDERTCCLACGTDLSPTAKRAQLAVDRRARELSFWDESAVALTVLSTLYGFYEYFSRKEFSLAAFSLFGLSLMLMILRIVWWGKS